MATQVEIIEIQLDVDQLTQAALGATESIKKLTEEQKKLQKAGESGGVQYKENTQQLILLKKEQQESTKALKDQITANTAAKGSNEQLRAQLALQTKEYNQLSKAERENEETGKKLQKSIKGISDELKGNEEAVGDNRRSVGDYGKALQGLNNPMVSAVSGFLNMTKAALAFIATPIGAVIAALGLAIGALAKYFTDTEEGANSLNKIMNVLSATFKVFTDLAVEVGKALFEALSNPKQLLIDLGNFVKENLINRFTAFGKILEGIIELDFGKIADGALQAATGVEDLTGKMVAGYDAVSNKISEVSDKIRENIELAKELSDIQNAQNVLEREALVENAKAFRDISELRLQAKDQENNTDKERLAFLKQAGQLENEILTRNYQLAVNNLEIARKQSAQGNDNIEDKKALAQAEAALFDVEKTNFDARRKLITEEVALQNKIQTEQDAALLLQQEKDAVYAETKRLLEEEEANRFSINLDQRTEHYGKYVDAKGKLDQKAVDAAIQADLKELESKRKKQEESARLSALEASQRVSAIGGAFSTISAGLKEGTDEQKAAAMISNVISTYQGATGAYASLSSIPVIGVSLATAAAAAIIAAGLSNLTKIASAATGGVFHGDSFGAVRVGGRSHSEGGTKYYGEDGNRFEVERGEIIAVVNRNSSAMISRLSQLNELGGGIPFAGQGSGFYQDGGIALAGANNFVDSRIQQEAAVSRALANIPTPIVLVEDIRAMVDQQVRVESIASI